MRAIEIAKPKEVRLVTREIPQIRNGEILLKINYVGFCGSDLSTYLGKNPMVEYPRIPGHEVSASIVEIGNDVPEKFKAGQKATVVPYTNCGQCASCKQKRYNACRYNETLGIQRDGAMTEFLVMPWQKILIDSNLSDYQLALVEPITVGFHAVDNAHITDLDIVLVFGCGMIGSGAILRANLRGATVIAVDIDDGKLELAKGLGAHFTINSKTQNLHDKLEELCDGNGPSVVIEAAGSPITYRSAIEEVGFCGRVVCIGYTNAEISFPTKHWVQKELQILGSRNANPSDFEAVIKYLKRGVIDDNLLISKVIQPEEAPQALQEWADNPGLIMKILVKF